jgi:DNA-binding NarL/FixJ family response regulator
LRVLVADDHEMMRSGLKNFFAQYFSGSEINEASSYAQVESFARRAGGDPPAIDLVLLDLRMPSKPGDEWDTALRTITTAFGATPVVVISGMEDPITIGTALKCGARGFLPKTMRGQSMHAALGLVLAGEVYVPPHLAANIIKPAQYEVAGRTSPAEINEPAARPSLTAREVAVVQLLVRGLSNKEIARALSVQEITVKVHLRSIFRKLGASNRVNAVRIAINSNLFIPDS